MSRSYSRKYERHESPSQERRESRAYERKEHAMGWEMPMHHRSKHRAHSWEAYFGEPHNAFGGMHHKKRR